MPVRVVLAHEHQVVRHALRLCLELQGMNVVGEAPNVVDALELVRHLGPDVAVFDLATPGLGGIDTCRQVLRECPRTWTIVLTRLIEQRLQLETVHSGAHGCVLGTRPIVDLITAVEAVARRGYFLSPIGGLTVGRNFDGAEVPTDPLSARERQVLQLIAESRTTKEIAAGLGISIKTVETHRSRIIEKLDIHETAGLVRYAIRRGLTRA